MKIVAITTALFMMIASPLFAAADENVVTPAAPGEYRVSQGDKLRIEVYKDAQLSQNVQVRTDGKITLPLIGDVQDDSKTPIQLRDLITSQLKPYMNHPVVTVIVAEPNHVVV